MKLNEKFSYLYTLFGAFFHQDWMVDYENEEMVIREYVTGGSAEEVGRTLEELDQFISLDLPVSELDKVMFDDLGCYYKPEPDGSSMRDWLLWVRSTLFKYIQLKQGLAPAPKSEKD